MSDLGFVNTASCLTPQATAQAAEFDEVSAIGVASSRSVLPQAAAGFGAGVQTFLFSQTLHQLIQKRLSFIKRLCPHPFIAAM
jgi:hypothetical protein